MNYLRKQAKDGKGPSEITSKDVFMSDEFLQPTLEDDALLFSLDDVLGTAEATNGESASTDDDAAALKQRLQDIEAQFAEYRLEVARTLDQRWNDRNDVTAGPSNGKSKDEELDEKYDRGYFETYSYNGTLLFILLPPCLSRSSCLRNVSLFILVVASCLSLLLPLHRMLCVKYFLTFYFQHDAHLHRGFCRSSLCRS